MNKMLSSRRLFRHKRENVVVYTCTQGNKEKLLTFEFYEKFTDLIEIKMGNLRDEKTKIWKFYITTPHVIF